jgi:hypothetical protein
MSVFLAFKGSLSYAANWFVVRKKQIKKGKVT